MIPDEAAYQTWQAQQHADELESRLKGSDASIQAMIRDNEALQARVAELEAERDWLKEMRDNLEKSVREALRHFGVDPYDWGLSADSVAAAARGLEQMTPQEWGEEPDADTLAAYVLVLKANMQQWEAYTQEKVAGVEAERDAANTELAKWRQAPEAFERWTTCPLCDHCLSGDHPTNCPMAGVHKAIVQANARGERLRSYVKHTWKCATSHDNTEPLPGDPRCDCGLRDAIRVDAEGVRDA